MHGISAKFDNLTPVSLVEVREAEKTVFRLDAAQVPAGTKRLEICLDFLDAQAGTEGYYIVPSKST